MLLAITLALAEEPVTPAPAPAPAPAPTVTLLDDGSIVLTYADGHTLVLPPDVVLQIQATVHVPPVSAPPLATAPAAAVPLPAVDPTLAVPTAPDTEWWTIDPNRGRYFYGPSAFSLGHLNGYVAQKEIAVTNVAIGLSDYFDVSIGTVIPTLFLEGGAIGVVAAKASVPLSEHVHVAVGGQVFGFSEGGIALPFGAITFGEPSRNLTVAGGALQLINAGARDPIALTTLSGVWRFGPQLALMSENWVVISSEVNDAGFVVFPSGGVRLYGKRFAVDLAAIVVDLNMGNDFGSPILPIPWLDFTYNWSIAPPGRSAPK